MPGVKMGKQERHVCNHGDEVVPVRLLFPCPLEAPRALGYPGDRRVSEFTHISLL